MGQEKNEARQLLTGLKIHTEAKALFKAAREGVVVGEEAEKNLRERGFDEISIRRIIYSAIRMGEKTDKISEKLPSSASKSGYAQKNSGVDPHNVHNDPFDTKGGDAFPGR